MLNLLEQYRLDQFSRDSYQVNHYLIEAMKFAFGHRMSLGDENFLNISNVIEAMQDKDYASILRQSLLDVSTMIFKINDYRLVYKRIYENIFSMPVY
jgi:gamma-glutamyltranspeptidase